MTRHRHPHSSSRTRGRIRALLLAIALLAAVLPAPAVGETAVVLPLTVDLTLPARSATSLPNVESSLMQVAEAYREGGASAAAAVAESVGVEIEDGRVEVTLEAHPGKAAEAASAAARAGAVVGAQYRDAVVVRVPVPALRGLAQSPAVAYVRQPYRPVPDVVVSEGVAEIGADVLHAEGNDGTGVRVGIIDAGFSGYATRLGTELPATVQVWPERAIEGSEVHGTAVAEIVYDVAPGAELYFAQIINDVELGRAVDWMIANGVDVINMSLGFFGSGPLDGTGPVNDIVDHAVTSGIFWANSAGNERQDHWSGDFVDADADGFLEYQSGAEVNRLQYVDSPRYIVGDLWWDDDWSAAAQDYDLGLVYFNGTSWSAVKWGADPQNGEVGWRPVERVVYWASSPGWYAWVVARYDATRTDVDFDLFTTPRLDSTGFRVPARSIVVPADNASDGAMSVAALGRTYEQEYYSSEGPTRDGRTVPEIAAPSAVLSSTYSPYFAGTSASSPHLAGGAALLRQAYPGLTPAGVEALIEARAIDIYASGPDTQTGAGRLWVDGPTLVSAGAVDATHADVTFDRELDPLSVASDGSDFTIAGLTVTAASVDVADASIVHLTTSTHTFGVTYTVECALGAVADLSGGVNAAGSAEYVRVPTLARYEESDARIAFSPGWNDGSSTVLSGGAMKWTGAKGAAVNISFVGPSISLVSNKARSYGSFAVSVDGVSQGLVSLYSVPTLYQQTVWGQSGLDPSTEHTVTITAVGNGTIAIDALDVTGDLTVAEAPPVPVRADDTDPKIAFQTGVWSTGSSTVLYGGSQHYSAQAGARLNIAFDGTAVSLVGNRARSYGQARMYLDGTYKGLIDCYSGSTYYQQTIYALAGLADGPHVLTLEVVGNGTIALDALDVTGDLTVAEAPPVPVRADDTDPKIAFQAGVWSTGSSTVLYGGSQHYSAQAGARLNIAFDGTAVSLVGNRARSYGQARMYLDGTYKGLIDCYSGSTYYQQTIYALAGLADGPHVLTLEVVGNGTIALDALDVTGELTVASLP